MYQNQMQTIVNKYYNADGQQKRLFWGSFGITDITDPTIQRMYYNSDKIYAEFQQIKK